LISEFKTDDLRILKHNNACGLATRNDKWRVQRCLSLWPNISIWWCIDCKHKIDVATAIEINKLFWSSYCSWIRCRIEILQQKKKQLF
jgi:phosphoribosylaminoimidazolecarboxamide formyltransferase/IMP cyclohydrolase